MPPVPTVIFVACVAFVAVFALSDPPRHGFFHAPRPDRNFCRLRGVCRRVRFVHGGQGPGRALLAPVGHLPALPVYGTARSGKWPALEKNWLKVHPHCAACGTLDDVSVHHKRPFHLDPQLELDPMNLITLCEKHQCHLMVGHSGDWHAYNPHVEEDARSLARRIKQRQYE